MFSCDGNSKSCLCDIHLWKRWRKRIEPDLPEFRKMERNAVRMMMWQEFVKHYFGWF